MTQKEALPNAERIFAIRGQLSLLREELSPEENSPFDYGLKGVEGSLEALSSIIGLTLKG